MAGRRPKPTHLKVVTGNPGKRKLNDKEPAPAKEIPSPPSHLTDWGKVAWGKVTVLLDGNGVYNTPQMFAFAQGAGIFAEAGPEAIMPLTRASDGSLGVRAVSYGVNNTSGNATNIYVEAPVTINQDGTGNGGNASDARTISSQLQSAIQLTITDRLRKEISPGGILYRN